MATLHFDGCNQARLNAGANVLARLIVAQWRETDQTAPLPLSVRPFEDWLLRSTLLVNRNAASDLLLVVRCRRIVSGRRHSRDAQQPVLVAAPTEVQRLVH
jgi:hypothetical protein